jgi:hypothetical protein
MSWQNSRCEQWTVNSQFLFFVNVYSLSTRLDSIEWNMYHKITQFLSNKHSNDLAVFTSVSKGRDVPGQTGPLSLCPGTNKFSCSGVPLSQDKGQNHPPKTRKGRSETGKGCSKLGKEVLREKLCSKTGWWRKIRKNFHFLSLFLSFLSRGMSWDGTGCQNPVPSHGKILSLSRCPFVPGQGRNFCPFVPKSCTVPSRWKC